MPTTDPIKNLMYVKKSQALKKEMIGIDSFNKIHAAEQQKHRDKLRKEKGNEEYKKQQAEYMKAYRQTKKAQNPQQLDFKTPAANIVQNAFINKIYRNAVLKLKQDNANSLISQIIGSNEPMQNDQTYFFSNIFFKFYNIIKIIIKL
jgi:hypothetical protein